MSSPADDWPARVRAALATYADPLLRAVAGRLVKPRANQPAEDLIDKAEVALGNAPVVDRRLRDLPPAARKLLGFVGRSRQPHWKLGHLLTLLAAVGEADGYAPVVAALDSGLLFPVVTGDTPVDDFAAWAATGGVTAEVFAPPAVASRARTDYLGLPAELAGRGRDLAAAPAAPADGLEWPLRLAVAWQQVGAAPVRLTQANTLFKKDLTRLQGDPLLSAPSPDHPPGLPEGGVLALLWARAAGLLADRDGELVADAFPEGWNAGLYPVAADLFAALWRVDGWDPLAGYAPPESGLSPATPAGLLALLLVASGGREGAEYVPIAEIAGWLWDRLPPWTATLPRESAKDRGAAWVANWLFGVCGPLGLVERMGTDDPSARLTPVGRWLAAGGPEPPPPVAFPQTLVVQPNAQVIAYRQGLTPGLVGTLSRFARWTAVGPACTLELTPEQTYRGLESGLTVAGVLQALNRHGTRPVPPGVADLLQRWANKRERIAAYTSAVLVEFATPADLDVAVARGVVAVKLTDRVGMAADGAEPALSHLRLTGNRDYESKPQKCVTIGPDGVTLAIDAALADLLLDGELAKFADPVPAEIGVPRRVRLTPQSLRRAADAGMTVGDLDGWFADRAGGPLPPAGRLLLLGPKWPSPRAARLLVVTLPTPEATDGLVQWPETAPLIADRLGPTAVVVEEASLDALRRVLAEIGVTVTTD